MDLLSPDGKLMETLGKVIDYVELNLLCLIFCLPIITAGASFTAKYYVAFKLAKGDEVPIRKYFWKGFKENFKQCTFIWVFALAMGTFLFYDWYMLLSHTGSGYGSVYTILLALISFICWDVFICIFMVIAYYNATTYEAVKAGAVMAFLYFPIMFFWALVTFIPYFIEAWYIVWALGIWLLCTSANLYYFSRAMVKELEKIGTGVDKE